MLERKKRGFSLIEIMILFAVLAVAMAATLPVITRRSLTVPRNVAHGVYRCIYSNGQYLEQTYSSIRALTPLNAVGQCSFRPPRASLFKIDIYSGGAGGTKFAAYNASNDDVRHGEFDMDAAASYARTGNFKLSNNTTTSDRTDMPWKITDKQIYDAFHSGNPLGGIYRFENMIISGYSADGGKGGDASYFYLSPGRSKCLATIETDKFRNYVDKLYQELTEAQSELDDYNSRNEKCEACSSVINNLSGDISKWNHIYYPATKNNTLFATEDDYNDYIALANKTYNLNDCNGIFSRWNNSLLIGSIENYLNAIKNLLYGIDEYRNDHKEKDLYDLGNDGNIQDKLDEIVNNAEFMNDLIGSAKSSLTSEKNDLDKIDKSELENKVQVAKDKYDPAKREFDLAKQEYEKKARPTVYRGKTDYRFDSNDYTTQQFSEYCKQTFPEYYYQSGEWHEGMPVFETGGDLVMRQYGGSGGKGKYYRLQYPLYPASGPVRGNLSYDGADYYHRNYSSYEYKFVKFIGDLFGDDNNYGFKTVGCNTRHSNGTVVGCGNTLPQKGKNGDNEVLDGRQGDSDSATVYESGDRRYIKAEDGSEVEKYIGYKIPIDFTNPYHGQIYASHQVSRAKGGKGGEVGYEVGHAILQENRNLEYLNKTNLAWKTYKKDGKDSAQDGQDAYFQPIPASGSGDAQAQQKFFLLPTLDKDKNNSTNAQDNIIQQRPKIEMDAELWSKAYKIGNGGTPGSVRHLKAQSLGSNCTIRPGAAGPTFDYVALVNEAINSDANVDSYLQQKKQEYESSLNSRMTCVDRDGDTVFDENVEGGKYNIDLGSWAQPFYWYENVDQHDVSGENVAFVRYTGRTSIWARILGTMPSLETYNIAKPGSATKMSDRCLKPKGTYEFKTYRMIKRINSDWETVQLTGTNQTFNRNFDGKVNEQVDCYFVLSNNNAYFSGQQYIFGLSGTDSNAAAREEYYGITPPDVAGGGAIVITW